MYRGGNDEQLAWRKNPPLNNPGTGLRRPATVCKSKEQDVCLAARTSTGLKQGDERTSYVSAARSDAERAERLRKNSLEERGKNWISTVEIKKKCSRDNVAEMMIFDKEQV